MPILVPLQALPNQRLAITLNNNLFDITVKYTNAVMSVSISINSVLVVENAHTAAVAPIIAAKYQENGNFMFLTANNQLPNYTQFGVTQSLFYFTPNELEAFRLTPVAPSPREPTVTALSFDPIAPLPLRFAPQGYVED